MVRFPVAVSGEYYCKRKTQVALVAFSFFLLDVIGHCSVCAFVRVRSLTSGFSDEDVLVDEASVRAADCSMWTGGG